MKASEFGKKAKDVIAAVAPTLGTALGGPLGGLAGNILASVLGKDGKQLEDVILEQKPETLLQLRAAEQDFKLKMRELDIREEDIHSKDRQSARDLAKVNMRPQMILSTVFITGYFFVLFFFFLDKIEITPEVKDAFLILIGVITANVPSIMQFWFGSSSGSKEKTEILGAKE